LKTDLLTLIEDLKASASEALVYLVKPPPIFSEWGGLSGEVLIKEVIPAIEQTAEELHFCVIDLFSALTDRSYFFDGVHPNGEGAKIVADLFFNDNGKGHSRSAIRPCLPKKSYLLSAFYS
jgi:lysophospholipase L1-like esterase